MKRIHPPTSARSVAVPIRLPSPAAVLVMGLAVYGVIWMLAPITPAWSGTVESWGVLFYYVIALLAGCLLGFRRWRGRDMLLWVDPVHVRRVVQVVGVAGSLGVVALVGDRLIRGGSLVASYMANREAISDQAFGPLAVVGQLLAPLLLFLPLFVFMKRASGRSDRSDWPLVLLASCYPLSSLTLLGSRSGLLVFIAVTFFSALTTKRLRVRVTHIAVIAVVGLSLLWVSCKVFWARTAQVGLDPLESVVASGYAHFVPVSGAASTFIYDARDSLVGFAAFAGVNFAQYYLHGLYEFLYLVDRFSSYHTWGGQSFFVPLKFLSTIAGIHSFAGWASGNQLRVGVYTTLFGPVFYDFGSYVGGAFCLIAGWLTGTAGRLVVHGSAICLPFYIYALVVIFFAPVVSLMLYGSGQTTIVSALALAFVLRVNKLRFDKPTRSGGSEIRERL